MSNKSLPGRAIGKALSFEFETSDGRGFEYCPGKYKLFTWKRRGSEPTLICVQLLNKLSFSSNVKTLYKQENNAN